MEVPLITVDRSTSVLTETSSRGNQMKWRTETGFWVKADFWGYEGLVEYLSYEILKYSNACRLNYPIVEYNLTRIYDKNFDREYLGCYSKDFLREGQTLITLGRIFEKIGKPYPDKNNFSVEERLIKTINLVESELGIVGFGEWLTFLLEFDRLILNEDRHFHNIGIILDQDEYKFMPIFDNGAGMFSDTRDYYPIGGEIKKYYSRVKSKPFSSSFDKQVESARELFGKRFRLREGYKDNCHRILDDIDAYPTFIVNRVKKILDIQFENFEK